ncbi:MAG TPA: carboxypeptidase regulatory-like domain-containing protein [Terriglobia bacterium]|jgi:hypothetical protein
MRTTPFLLLILMAAAAAAQQAAPEKMTIAGTVIDKLTGQPIAGVTIVPPIPPLPKDAPDPRPTDPPRRPLLRSASDGTFTINDVGRDDGPFLRFTKSGYIDRSLNYMFSPAQGLTMKVRMQPTGIISGRVFDPKGGPEVDMAVTIYGYTRDHILVPKSITLTDDRGEYRLLDVIPGRYLVGFATKARRDTRLPANAPMLFLQFFTATDAPDVLCELYPGAGDAASAEIVEVKGGEEARLKDSVLGGARLGDIRVHLTNGDGSHIGDANLVLNGYGDNRSGQATAVALNLDFTGPQVKVYRPNGPGIFSAELNWKQTDGTVAYLAAPIEFTGRDVDVDIPVSKPSGQLEIHAFKEDSKGGTAPAPGASFRFCRPAMPCNFSDFTIKPEFGSFTPSDPKAGPDGTVRLLGLSEGRYVLRAGSLPLASGLGDSSAHISSATQAGHDVLKDGVLVSKSPSVVEIHFKSEAGGRVRGNVFNHQGHNVEDGVVALWPEELQGVMSLHSPSALEVGASGQFNIRGIRPGLYRAYAWSDARLDQALDPDFVQKFRDRATAVTIVENGDVALDLSILDGQ